MKTRDDKWLAEAVALAERSVGDGGGPFGALIVRGDDVVANGVNQVTSTLDPTAHAEVVAIRRACEETGDFTLTGCVLVSSCEPCPMCLFTALWARVDRVVYAADRDDAAAAGFDDRAFHDLFGKPRAAWPVELSQHRTGGETSPFDAWRAKPDKVEY
ncbi:guanine deaminase [Herbihabitans rhizosphaerae]|uniref:Guanine deaminase n=1 Tax=Herbihabitans rhizosphaerae TaxID=1872711 RepID=A0A4Q7L2P8_9PSEU|nr:nucleoside deaminase [Herbihabitans rhizosphaerae]RZS43386.1 guanine deaminase [Herbihabitans rhizosphaerae]